jgi:hypothetical protein
MPGEFSSTPFPTFATITLPARSFDGATQYVNAGNNTPLNIANNAPMALCCWINFATLAGTQTFIGKGFDGSTTAYMFQQGGGILSFGSFSSSTLNGTLWNPSTWGTGQWHHCYGDYTGSGGTPASTWRIYIDGGFVISTFNTIGPINNGRSFVMGGVDTSSSGVIQLLTGCMADAALFNGPLTTLEIGGLGSGSIRPTSSMSQTLLGYWPLSGTPSPEPDNSPGSPNPGTVVGTNPSVCGTGPP